MRSFWKPLGATIQSLIRIDLPIPFRMFFDLYTKNDPKPNPNLRAVGAFRNCAEILLALGTLLDWLRSATLIMCGSASILETRWKRSLSPRMFSPGRFRPVCFRLIFLVRSCSPTSLAPSHFRPVVFAWFVFARSFSPCLFGPVFLVHPSQANP